MELKNAQPKRVRVGLLWQSLGHGNLGVDALARANIEIIQSACATLGIVPTFVQLGRPNSWPESGVDLVEGPRFRLRDLARIPSHFRSALRSCDILFDLSEGDSFTDIYGVERFFYQALSKITAIQSRRPYVLSPQTIGPFDQSWSKPVAKWIIEKSSFAFSRDSMSLSEIENIAPRSHRLNACDVAFRLPFDQLGKSKSVVKIGLNISGLMYAPIKKIAATNFRLDYREFTHRLIRELSRDVANELWLVPHVLTGSEDESDDLAVSLQLLSQYPQLRLAQGYRTSFEVKSFISGMDFFVGGRMHACIGAMSAGVAVVPIAYSRKFPGLFGDLGYEYLVDARSTSVDDALSRTLGVLDCRVAIAEQAKRCSELALRNLGVYEACIVDLIGGLTLAKAE